MNRKRFFIPILFLIAATSLCFYACQKQKNYSKYAGIWDLKLHWQIVHRDSNALAPQFTDTTYHFVGKLIHLKEEGVLRLIFTDKDTIEFMVGPSGEIHSCSWFSSACIFRGFYFEEWHGEPAGYFSNYRNLSELYMRREDERANERLWISGTKIAKE